MGIFSKDAPSAGQEPGFNNKDRKAAVERLKEPLESKEFSDLWTYLEQLGFVQRADRGLTENGGGENIALKNKLTAIKGKYNIKPALRSALERYLLDKGMKQYDIDYVFRYIF